MQGITSIDSETLAKNRHAAPVQRHYRPAKHLYMKMSYGRVERHTAPPSSKTRLLHCDQHS